MYNKKLWIIVIILIVAIILLVGFAALNPNKPVTYILENFMNSQQISNFNEIANKCGFKVNVILYIKDGNVKSIRFADNYLYNDGNYFGELSDYLN